MIAVSREGLVRVVRELCGEIAKDQQTPLNWRSFSEVTLWREIVVGVLSSQSRFELAEAVATHMHRSGILSSLLAHESGASDRLQRAMASVHRYRDSLGIARSAMVRFPSRSTQLMLASVRNFRSHGMSLRSVVRSATSAVQLRCTLISLVAGFGPKQASMYIRRIGYSDDLAILDTHILWYLAFTSGISSSLDQLQHLRRYEQLEARLRTHASGLGTSLGIFDFATWVTVRTAKQQGIV